MDDFEQLKVLPIEVKSGKDYTRHSALTKFLETPDYGIDRAIVFSNEREVFKKRGVTYMPVYYCMFLQNRRQPQNRCRQHIFRISGSTSHPATTCLRPQADAWACTSRARIPVPERRPCD